jgi:hypothetical protein
MRPNITARDGEISEKLIGGPCDGLNVLKTTKKIVYSGIFGTGIINIYKRREDGRLHFSGVVYRTP